MAFDISLRDLADGINTAPPTQRADHAQLETPTPNLPRMPDLRRQSARLPVPECAATLRAAAPQLAGGPAPRPGTSGALDELHIVFETPPHTTPATPASEAAVSASGAPCLLRWRFRAAVGGGAAARLRLEPRRGAGALPTLRRRTPPCATVAAPSLPRHAADRHASSPCACMRGGGLAGLGRAAQRRHAAAPRGGRRGQGGQARQAAHCHGGCMRRPFEISAAPFLPCAGLLPRACCLAHSASATTTHTFPSAPRARAPFPFRSSSTTGATTTLASAATRRP